MRSTFYGLEIAKTGLFTSQNSLEVSGHNISNVDTPGFTRQRLNTAAIPAAFGNTFIAVDSKSTAGRGVTTINIERVRNSFLDYQYRKENTTTTRYSVKEQYFEYVESLFNNELDSLDTSNGISKIFSNFYDALYELHENPERTEIRVNLQEQAITMCETLNYYSNRLQEQQTTLNQSVKITVNEINSLADQIAAINKQITAYEMTGASANDLRDQRDQLLDTLSGLVPITTYEDVNGQLVVEVAGKNLVHHGTKVHLAIYEDHENTLYNGEPRYTVVWADSKGNPTESPVSIKDGALAGYMEVRDGRGEGSREGDANVGIPFVLESLDKLCQKIAKDMNEVHEKGYTIPSEADSASRTGIKFFDVPTVKEYNIHGVLVDKLDEDGNVIYDYSQITAENFRLSNDVRDNPFAIAASDSPVAADGEENEQKGNGKIALEMCGIISKKDEAGNPDSIDSVYKTLLNEISLQMEYIHNTVASQEVMQGHLSDQRTSISGVSLDEEMTNIIRFGHAYNAASRVISAIDEELDKLINGTGRVGL